MNFSLLAPAALGLLALGALPILAHLSLRTPRERQAFGAMLLLERVVKRLRRRRRVRDPLLLLLRLLAVLALAFAVAAPRWSFPGGAPEHGGTGRVVLLVDHSMSMSMFDGGAPLLERARAEARAVIEGLPAGAEVGVVAFGREARRLTPELTTDHASALARIDALQPTFDTTDLRGAVLEARRLLAGEPGEILLFSDEAGPGFVADALGELELLVASGNAVEPVALRSSPPRNVAIRQARYGDGLEGGRVAITLTNYGQADIEVPCEVSLPDGQRIPIFAELPADGELIEPITVPREALGGVGEVQCDDPDLPTDDVRFFHLPRVGASRVLVVDGDPGDTPTASEVYFLERALAPWGGTRTGITPDVVTPAGLADLDPDVHQVVFLANVADPRPLAAQLSDFVRRGGAVVLALGDNVAPDRYNAAFGTLLPSPLRRTLDIAAPEEPGVALELPRGGHPLFEPFERSGRGAFSSVRTHRVMTLDPFDDTEDVTTLLRYTTGQPAMVERRVGTGRFVVWTSSFDTAWTNAPLQAAFMPTIQRLVATLGGEVGDGAERLSVGVGEAVSVQLPELAVEPIVEGPGGDPVRARFEGSRVVFTPDRPGAYAVRVPDGPPLAWVASNLDPRESDVRVYETVTAAEARLRPEMFQRHIDLSPWAWGVALVLLVLSAGLALVGGVGQPEEELA